MNSSKAWCVVLVVALGACGGGGAADDAAVAGEDAGLERGPATILVEGDPNGLFWDGARHTLLVADDDGNRILSWTDGAGFSQLAALPVAPASGPGLGQLVRTSDGSIVVTRFGFGTAGDVAVVPPSGEPYVVAGLDVERRRIGLAVATDGALYDTWFVRVASGARVGAVGTLDLSGAEPEILTGLGKPVGVLADADFVYVSDQDAGQILRAQRRAPSFYEVMAHVESPDLLAFGPDGSLFTGTGGTSVAQVSATGSVAVIGTGFRAVRGLAYDAEGRRLFVVDHDPDDSDGVSHAIRILPIE